MATEHLTKLYFKIFNVTGTIMKFLGYPLAALTLSEKQCDQLMKPITQASLPKMGIVKNMCKSYLYGPRAIQGLAFPNIFTELCIARLKILLQHGGTDLQLGQSLICCAEGHQLEIRSFLPFFSLPFEKYGKLCSSSILEHTWSFVKQLNMSIKTHHHIPVPLCINDTSIKDKLLKADCTIWKF